MSTSRNAPCPCGSGKKYKQCCGKMAQAVTAPPGFDVASLLKQAFAFHQAGQLQQAEVGYRRVLEAQPNHADALHLLGQIAESTGRLDIARDLISRASGVKPGEALYRLSLARVLLALKQPAEAEIQARKVLQLRPGTVEAFYTLANAFKLQDKLPEAIREYERVLAIEPRHAGALNNLGAALNDAGMLGESLSCLRRFLEVQPGSVEGMCSVGNALRRMGRFGEAIEYYQRALQLRPSHEIRFSHSLCLLGLGLQDRAWEEYAERFYKESDPVSIRPFSLPWWQGEDLNGKRLLVWGEQGVGDEILFASVLPDAIRDAEKVIVECDARLVNLFARSFPEAEVIARRDPPDPRVLGGDIELQSPSGNLPRWYRPTLESFPDRRGFLVPDAERVAYWKGWLETLGPGPRVGIAWRSGLRRVDRDGYYTELNQWGDILRPNGAVFINLQYGDCEAELSAARQQFGVEIHMPPGIDLKDDLDEVAALMAALDLVITAGTTVAAMAGAIGQTSWMYNLDSAWDRLGTMHYPWLPSISMYLKAWDAPWEPVLKRIGDDLENRVKSDLI